LSPDPIEDQNKDHSIGEIAWEPHVELRELALLEQPPPEKPRFEKVDLIKALSQLPAKFTNNMGK
jgi:hypothetical protein